MIYSGFWRRVAAALIDGLLLSAVVSPFTVASIGTRSGSRLRVLYPNGARLTFGRATGRYFA